MIEPTDEMVQAFRRVWRDQYQFGIASQEGATREGLAAVLAIVEGDRPQATEYTLSALPEDHIEASQFEIKVAYRGHGLWAVIWKGYCLNRRGVWDWEPLPSSRTDRWLAGHRFELEEALRLARKELPRLKANGRSAADLINDQDGRS